MEAYGVHLGRRYCDLERRDFGECIHHDKEVILYRSLQKPFLRTFSLQIKRNKAMRQERMKQFLDGKLERPFIADHPKSDGHSTDYFSHNYVP